MPPIVPRPSPGKKAPKPRTSGGGGSFGYSTAPKPGQLDRKVPTQYRPNNGKIPADSWTNQHLLTQNDKIGVQPNKQQKNKIPTVTPFNSQGRGTRSADGIQQEAYRTRAKAARSGRYAV